MFPSGMKPQTPAGRSAMRSRQILPDVQEAAAANRAALSDVTGQTPGMGVYGPGVTGIYTPPERQAMLARAAQRLGLSPGATSEDVLSARMAAMRPQYTPMDARQLMVTARAQGGQMPEPMARMLAKLNLGREVSPLEAAATMGPGFAETTPAHYRAREREAALQALGGLGGQTTGGEPGGQIPFAVDSLREALGMPPRVRTTMESIATMSPPHQTRVDEIMKADWNEDNELELENYERNYGFEPGTLTEPYRRDRGMAGPPQGRQPKPVSDIGTPFIGTPSRKGPYGLGPGRMMGGM